jgi:hypothetical protein
MMLQRIDVIALGGIASVETVDIVIEAHSVIVLRVNRGMIYDRYDTRSS